jgi:hypothetical protein
MPASSRCRVWASVLHGRLTVLHQAARIGHAAVVAALLTLGADVNAHGWCGGRSLCWAAVGVRCAAVADRDGIGAVLIRMRSHGDTRTRTRTHTHTHAQTHTHTVTCTQLHTHTHTPPVLSHSVLYIDPVICIFRDSD